MGDRPQKAPFFKTKLCPWYPWRRCRMGSKCNWAHNMSELRPSVDLTRTKLCETLLKIGYCDKPICRFAHSRADLRATTDVYKTALCVFWERGYCAAEASCRYAHGVEDIRDNRKANGRAAPPIPKTVIPGEELAYKGEGSSPSSDVDSVKDSTSGGCTTSSIKNSTLLDSVFDSRRTHQPSLINDVFAFSSQTLVDETSVTSETSSPSCVESLNTVRPTNILRTALRSSSSTIASSTTDSLPPDALAFPFPQSYGCDTDAHAAHEEKHSLCSKAQCHRQPLQAIFTQEKTSTFTPSTMPIHNVLHGLSTHQLNNCGRFDTIHAGMFTHCSNRSFLVTGAHKPEDSCTLSCPCCFSSRIEKTATLDAIALSPSDEEHSANAYTTSLDSNGVNTITKSSWGHLEQSLAMLAERNRSPPELVPQVAGPLSTEKCPRGYDSRTCNSVNCMDATKEEFKADAPCLEFSTVEKSDPVYYCSLHQGNASEPCIGGMFNKEGYTSAALYARKPSTSPIMSSHASLVSRSTAAMVTSKVVNHHSGSTKPLSLDRISLSDTRNRYTVVDGNVFPFSNAAQLSPSSRVQGREMSGVKSPEHLKYPTDPTWNDFMHILRRPYAFEAAQSQTEVEEETFRTLFDFSADKVTSPKPHPHVDKCSTGVCDLTENLFAGVPPFGWVDNDPLPLPVEPLSISDNRNKDIRSIWAPLRLGMMHSKTPDKLFPEAEPHPELPYLLPASQHDLPSSKTAKGDPITGNAKETDFLPPLALSGYNQFGIFKGYRATRRTTISTRARTGSRSSSRDFSTTSDTSSSSAERRSLLDLVNEVQGLTRNSAVPCLAGERD